MIDLDTEICVCNSLTARDIIEFIQENDISSLDSLLENEILPMGDKCESCKDEGFHNDGINIPLIFSMARKLK